ncbi:hypothetical protein Cgig2_003849 [Carnegiea gigantea]|uniref:Uncharacterized protein n=1 Tax=Carnegiea gigantea TaxID=171969 RepID=A0A9Q1GVD1_9CARY|nr:hypothetical protein Cgig2_003849 [Carnegiea gigantea]
MNHLNHLDEEEENGGSWREIRGKQEAKVKAIENENGTDGGKKRVVGAENSFCSKDLSVFFYPFGADVGKKRERGLRAPNAPPGLFFQHAGHRDKVVDFHWNAYDPWTIVSVSDDCDSSGGGGTLQIWRMSDLIYRPEEEVLAELEQFKSHVATCASKS